MVTRLINYNSNLFPDKLQFLLNSYNFVFNPSLVIHNDCNYLAVRVYDDQLKSIRALLFIWTDVKAIKQVNLSNYFYSKLGCLKVADPKLFVMNNSVYGTFNTGDGIDDFNTLVLFELSERKIKNYYFCDYKLRTKTEKNWAFYVENNKLYALYSLSPLTILKATDVSKGYILFEKYYSDENQNYVNCSIGTPLLEVNGSYKFITHKKYYRKRKLLYLGRLSTLTLQDKPSVEIKKSFLIHSFRTLLGNRHKFNKNLISCTYFSGICMQGDEIVLSYGINDVSSNIVRIKQKELWH